jgi:penicillin-binding protein 1C
MTSKRKIQIGAGVFCCVLVIIYYYALPDPLFKDSYSTVLDDRNGNLLSASIAADGQWRFPQMKTVPQKFKDAILVYEDKRFGSHPGVDVISLGRAIRQNIKAGKIVSGGSTLTMQLIRLSRKGKSRTVLEKIIEIILATRAELRFSKDELLSHYAAHAPFGGNVVGIEAACWRYFLRDPQELSWSEAALLAVLPNNPSLIHLGKNRDRLKLKRDRLLDRLNEAGKLDRLSLVLAKAEPVPANPLPLPRHAVHLLDRLVKEGFGQTEVVSTIDGTLQQRLEQIVVNHYQRLRANQIFNAAAVILEVKTGNVLAYVGNTQSGKENQDNVDVVTAPRSTGSILKPFLFAAMLDEGKMLQKTLMPDYPTTINGFSPRNFSHEFDGAVPADKALIRSLNIPVVYELKEYRYEKFHALLKNIGLTSLNQPADRYGLTLVLGGAEGTLWDITGAYASMARTLNNYSDVSGRARYHRSDFHSPRYRAVKEILEASEENSFLNAASIWLTFETLKEVYRPGEETGWRYFNSSKKIAWKTGTSFGFRDGWAAGVNPEYAVGVWVGNADGEGRPGLVGSETAAPILFDIFSILPGQPWFQQPVAEMERISVCSESGQRASSLCIERESQWIVRSGLQTPLCQFHQQIHLSRDEKFRVHSECVPIDQMKLKSWFVLPPVQEYYFKSKNLSYRLLPPFRKDCVNPASISSLDLIYPKPNSRIYIPRELNGTMSHAVFEAAHRMQAVTVYWHLDGNFIGSTKKKHQMALAPLEGTHKLTLVDEFGETLERTFSVLSRQ